MSADNWAICPRCLKRARAEHDEAVANVQAMYGKVPVEEFDAARARIADVSPEDFRTFREDYEFWVSEAGVWSASYGGHCEKCDLTHNFNEEAQLDV